MIVEGVERPENKGRFFTWSDLQSEMWQNARHTLHM